MFYLWALIVLLSLFGNCKTALSFENSTSSSDHRISIRLCCKPSELFNGTTFQCEELSPEFDVNSWELSNFWSDGNAAKVHILKDLNYKVEKVRCEKPFVFGFFEYQNDSEHCYTPYYHTELRKYIIATVDCASIIQVYNFIYDTYIFAIGFSTFFLLLSILVYGILKELRSTLHWKLFLCHFISWLIAHVLIVLSLYFMCIETVLYAWIFFVSTHLWLNVIGYEIWLQFAHTFRECELKELTRRRFSLYSLYVWGGSLLISLTSWFLKDSTSTVNWHSLIPIVVMMIIALAGFGYHCYKIWIIRQKVVNTAMGSHFIRKSLPTVLFVIYMNVLPWVMLLIMLLFYTNVFVALLFYVYLIAEGPIMFAICVPARKLRFLWSKRISRRNNRHIDSHLTDDRSGASKCMSESRL